VAQPSTSQVFDVVFPVRNTSNQPLTVAYDIHENVIADPIDPTSGPAVTGSVTVPAFGVVSVTQSIPVQAAGSHAWSIILDPGGLIAERNEANNTATLRVEVADFDVSFGSPAPQVTVPPVAGDLTIDFAITNTNNAAAAAPTSADVNVAITIDGGGAVTVTSISSGAPLAADPLPITVGAGLTVPVRLTVQRPAVGNHTYTIVLTPTVADSNTANNTTLVVTPSVN
jgi:subtilase family serine protease